MPGKKCIHAQISVHSFYGTLAQRQVDVQSQQKLLIFQFSIVFVNFLCPSPDKENPQKIETETDVIHKRRKILDLFYFRHYLWYPEKDTYSGKS